MSAGQQHHSSYSRSYNPNSSQMQHNAKMNTIQVPSTAQVGQGMMSMNIQDLYKQYGAKPASEYHQMNDQSHQNSTGYHPGPGQAQMQQFFNASHQANQMQRSAVTGQTKHRAISVTEAPKPLMEASPQNYLGFQKSVNNGMNHSVMGHTQQSGSNHFGNRHSSQSSQQPNRKNYKEYFAPHNNNQGASSQHQPARHGGVHYQLPASAGAALGGSGPGVANGSIMVTTTAGGQMSGGSGSYHHAGGSTAYAAPKTVYNRKFK